MKLSGANSTEVAAPAEICRGVLTDFDAYVHWFPGAHESRLVSGPGEPPAGHLRFSAAGVLPDVEFTMRYSSPAPDRLVPEIVEGALRISGPGWELLPLSPDRTRVTYEVELEMSVPGGFLGERALKGPATRYLIEQPVERLRQRAESLAASD